MVERVARVIVANHRPTCSKPSIIPVCNWKQTLVLVDTRFSLTETSVVRLIKDSSYMKSYSCYEVNSLCKRYRNHWSNKKSNRCCQCCSGVMLGIKIILNLLVARCSNLQLAYAKVNGRTILWIQLNFAQKFLLGMDQYRCGTVPFNWKGLVPKRWTAPLCLRKSLGKGERG